MKLRICKTLEWATEWKDRIPTALTANWGILLGLMLFLVLPIPPAQGQGLLRPRGAENKQTESVSATSDPTNIPWNSLDARPSKMIREVMNDKTFLRQMPRQVAHCDPDMYDFLIDHPDVVVELWEQLGVTQISLTEIAPNKFELKEGASSTSQVEILYKSKNLCIVYANGEYEAPVLRRKIKGDVVLLLKSRFGRDKEGRPVVQCDLDAYVRILNPGAEMLAKMLLPVVGKVADSNFEQTVGFVANVSETAQDDYESLQIMAQRMKNVRPEVADEFALVAEAVFDREMDRFLALTGGELSPSELVRRIPAPAIEANAMPHYALLADDESTPQDQTPVSSDSLMSLLPPPRTLSITNDNRSIMPTLVTAPPMGEPTLAPVRPPLSDMTMRDDRLSTGPTTIQPIMMPANDRVMIHAISPTTSPVMARINPQQQTPPLRILPQPSITQFGTTTPVIPPPSRKND